MELNKLHELIDNSRDAMVASLQGCIRIPSVYADDNSGYPYGKNVKNALDYMLALAESLGFRTHNMDNQVGWCEYGDSDEMVAVLGHLDVVPEGEGWSVPPYEGRVVDGRIYGRGSMDDKGPVVASLYALKALKDSGVPLKRRIRLIFGCNEETGSADMKYYMAHGGEVPVMGITPDGEYPVINGEKGLVTEFFARDYDQAGQDIQVIELNGGAAHNIVPDKAYVRLACSDELAEQILAMTAEEIKVTREEGGVRIDAFGVNAHGGHPEEGKNAIGRLMIFLKKLPLSGDLKEIVDLLADKLGMEWDGTALGVAMEDELSGPFTMNLGVVRASDKHIEVHTNYRYPVTRTFEECGPAVKAAFYGAGFETIHFLHKNRIYMAPDCELVQKLLKVYRAYTGDMSEPMCIGGGTYAKMIPNTLAFGPIFPGDVVREHKPDEYMEIDRLVDNAKILVAAIQELAN